MIALHFGPDKFHYAFVYRRETELDMLVSNYLAHFVA